MSTKAQIAANRANAEHSTGPRTEAGKARTRTNATRHSLCATISRMPGEQYAEFSRLLENLREEHQPATPTEDILVYKMAEHFFTGCRAQDLLTEALRRNSHQDNSRQIALMMRYHTTADRGFTRSLNELRKLQKDRGNEPLGFVPQNAEPAPLETKAEQPEIASPAPYYMSAEAPAPSNVHESVENTISKAA